MKRLSLTMLALVVILALFVVTSAGAQSVNEPLQPLAPAPSAEDGLMTNESAQLWFVELKGKPTASGGKVSDLTAEQAAFRNNAAKAGVNFTERMAYRDLWNGLSVSVASAADAAKLRTVTGVAATYPVMTVSMPVTTPSTADPDLYTALAQTGADIVQSGLGFNGQGVKVAVMDTGVDYNHPDLGGCFGAGCRVATGWDFVGDAFNADPASASYNPVASPDADPDDCNGHGSHVAGIVGASGTVTGVAPGVTFGAYRVFGCNGSTTSDIMLAAMERIQKDKMDVLNMSIGAAFQWPQYPTAQAANRLVERGIVVVASIGNSGASGLYSAGAPGLGEKVIGVASFENTHIRIPVFTVSPDGTQIGYTNSTGAPAAPTSGTFPLARTGTPTTTNDACNPLAAGSLTGQVVLIRRGTCSFYQKAFNAQSAGAAAVILYNNVAGRINATVAGSPAITIPVVAVSDTEGVLINNRIAAGGATMTWTALLNSFPNALAGRISDFSSYGLAPDLTLKPDIGAPGGNIFSTYPLEKGGYANISGTSMASPHVAGAAALYLQAHPGTPAGDVAAIFQNSADPHNWWGNPALGFLDNVHRQGAGMLDIDDAILADTLVLPGELALGESEAGPATRTLTIYNHSASSATYTLGHVGALATGPNTFVPSFFLANAGVTFSATSVTVPAGSSATVEVTISAPSDAALANKGMYGGYLTITDGTGGTYRVPYAGLKGDYQSIQAMTPTANGFPWLARPVGTSFVNVPTGGTFTLQGADVPTFLVHFDHNVAYLEFEIRNAVTGQRVHPVFSNAIEEQWLPRNSTSTGFFAFAWDGTRLHSNGNQNHFKTVPDGSYTVTIRALKALGDRNNPAHWETWTSPTITLDRP